ncbi:metal-binding protein [Hapalosiphon sp. MRB220]|nr:metal-binding protein [Hapalosiphon sp. MRB220]
MIQNLFDWINKIYRPLLAAIITTGIVATTYATVAVLSKENNVNSSNNSQTVVSNSQLISNTSIWDKETEFYSGKREITVYRSPSCSCCGAWIEHMQKHGFKINEDIKTDEMEAIKQKYNLPQDLASCHTAIIDSYVMEGHIPADDIKRFLKQKPKFAGLAVPGMPLGTPGMESGNRKQPFAIVAFDKKGKVEVFKEYQNY